VPLTAGGKLTIVASADLGALGQKDGSPADYDWTLASLAPLLLPWLAILGLLALRSNRNAAAWLIWLPLGCVTAFTLAPPMMPAGADFLLDVIGALAVGLGALWLLSNHLQQSNRLLTSCCVLFALAGFSVLAFVCRLDWNAWLEAFQIGIVLAIGILATAGALYLVGLICRNRYRPLGLYLWLFVSLTAIWLATTTPFYVVALTISGQSIPGSDFFIPVLMVAIGNFALVLPFLILSSASPFFRERLKVLLHVKLEAPPVLNAPAPDVPLNT
jgi:hypothetical protein